MSNTEAKIERIEGVEATYSPEDNKMRLYSDTRLDSCTYALVKDAGFKWAPKQELFVAPKWTPAREDFCLAIAGEIEPEGTTLAERAEMKAERLDAIATNKTRKANAFTATADTLSRAFEFGQPILVGHHSERKARRTQERMHNNMSKAVESRRAASHYLYRAESVQRHADYKARPDVRVRRIKTLLSDLRGHQRTLNSYAKALEIFEPNLSDKLIMELVGIGQIGTVCIAPFGTWQKMVDGEIDPQAYRLDMIEKLTRLVEGSIAHRWIEHLLNRLAYERELLGDVARFEGALTPTVIQAFAREHGAEKPKATKTEEGSFKLESPVPLPLHLVSGTSTKCLSLSDEAWRDLMQNTGYQVPAKKTAKPSILNFKAEALDSENQSHPGEVITYTQIELTKAEYSAISSCYRGTRLSKSKTFRFKTCLDPRKQPAGQYRQWVAVFLTDSKTHPIPDSLQTEEAKDAA